MTRKGLSSGTGQEGTVSDDKNLTIIGMRKQAKGEKLSEEELFAVERHQRFMIALRKFIEHMMDYWRRWLTLLVSGIVTAEYSGLINVVD